MQLNQLLSKKMKGEPNKLATEAIIYPYNYIFVLNTPENAYHVTIHVRTYM